MVKKDEEIDASFNISHLLKRTPKKWRENRESLVSNVETAAPCLLKVRHSEC